MVPSQVYACNFIAVPVLRDVVVCFEDTFKTLGMLLDDVLYSKIIKY